MINELVLEKGLFYEFSLNDEEVIKRAYINEEKDFEDDYYLFAEKIDKECIITTSIPKEAVIVNGRKITLKINPTTVINTHWYFKNGHDIFDYNHEIYNHLKANLKVAEIREGLEKITNKIYKFFKLRKK